MRKSCGACGRPFEAKRLSAKFCSDLCRKRAQRGKTAPSAVTGPPVEGPGPVERQVRADVAALVTAHPMGESLAEMSFSLARLLDGGTDAAASVNRELRANLLEMARLADDDDDELADDLSRPELPAEVRYPEEP